MRENARIVPALLTLATWSLAGCDRPGEAAGATAPPERVEIELPAREIAAVPEAESAESAYFSFITSVAVDPAGRVYVGDFYQAVVTVLSPEGEVVRTMGRSGSGPGEFRSVQGIQVFADGDSLLVFDRGASRLSAFALGSDAPAYISRLSDHTQVFPMDVWKLPSGNLLADFAAAYVAGEDPRARRMKLLRILDGEGRLLRDSVLEYPERDRLVFRDGGRLSVAVHPFGRNSVVRPGPDGTFTVGWSGDTRVRTYDEDGRLLRTVAIGHPLQAIDGADARRAAESLGPQHVRLLEEATPATWPEFKYLQVDDRGRVWVAPYERGGVARRWTVLDPGGAPVATVRFPVDLDIRLIRDGRIYGVTRDTLDVPRLGIFSLEEPLS